MGRFRWLEMEEEPKGGADAPGAVDGADMDEAACLAKGDRYLREGHYESALQWYSRALRYDVKLEEAWAGQVRCLLELQENVEANMWADRGLERFPDSPDLLAAKAMALRRTRGAARAMEYSDASLGVKGTAVGPYPWIVRGDIVLNGGGSRQSAERCFSKALELGGRDWYTHYLIGQSLLRRGIHEEARKRLSAAAGLQRTSALLFCAIGECQERLGEVGAAILAYRRALEADPRHKPAKDRLAALERVGFLGRLLQKLRARTDRGAR